MRWRLLEGWASETAEGQYFVKIGDRVPPRSCNRRLIGTERFITQIKFDGDGGEKNPRQTNSYYVSEYAEGAILRLDR